MEEAATELGLGEGGVWQRKKALWTGERWCAETGCSAAVGKAGQQECRCRGGSGGEGKDGDQAGVGSWARGRRASAMLRSPGITLPAVRAGGCEQVRDLTKLTL